MPFADKSSSNSWKGKQNVSDFQANLILSANPSYCFFFPKFETRARIDHSCPELIRDVTDPELLILDLKLKDQLAHLRF